MDMSQYLEIFIDESKDHLQNMNEILLTLEKDKSDLSLLNEIFRVAHTIKGMAGTMGFTKVANLTHEMENVLHLVRNKEIEVNTAIIDLLFECFDALEAYVGHLESTGKEGTLDTTDLVERLKVIAETKSADHIAPKESVTVQESPVEEEPMVEEAPAQEVASFSLDLSDVKDVLFAALDQANQAHMVRITLDEGCLLKSARAFIVFNTLEQFGEVLKSDPTAELIEDEKFDRSFELLYVGKLSEKALRSEMQKISEISSVEIAPVTAEMLEDTGDYQPVVTRDEITDLNEKIQQLKDTEETEDVTQKIEKAKTSKTVRVDISRLDNLMNLVSELIIIKTRLEDHDTNTHQNLNDTVEYLERITTSLHDAVMKVRMVPVERTFNRFPRMVRDLSRDLGKNINLIMSGEETEVDRTVIDEIGDPLIHLIRNSIDHGIESPEERYRLEKPEQGTVALKAYPDGNTVVIEVEDDGGGIDSDRVLKKAIHKGLVTSQEVENLNQQEIINLLFMPGFSTAETVTDLSGRGVGLDVVKSKIESLNGTVEVQSQKGKGSKFIIRLPLTLAIIQALMVNLAEEKYAVPLNNIKEITTIPTSDLTLIQNQEVVLYRNKTLPILRLGDILNVERPADAPEEEEMVVVIVKKGQSEAGLVVDSLIGQQEIVIKSLGKYLAGIKIIAGATILGNGGVALIVDPNQLF
jgi:two-component system chemotaxis sensor kinase CheA